MLYFFGPASVVSFQDDSRGGVEANCVAVFRTAAGSDTVEGRVTLSKTHALSNRLRVLGDNGVLELAESSSDSVAYFPGGSELRHEITCARRGAGDENYFRIQLEDFARAICTGGEPLTNGEQAAASVALMEECYGKASRLEEPWVDVTLERLRAALPAGTPQSWPSGPRRVRSSAGCFMFPERVLVTGAAGFIGTRLCEALHMTHACQVRAFLHSAGSAARVARFPVDFVLGDLCDARDVERAMDGVDAVVHLARGSTQVMRTGLENLLRAAFRHRISRFVHMSSVAVYGNDPPPAQLQRKRTGASH